MTPKDWIVYIDTAGVTRAVIALHLDNNAQEYALETEGNNIIGFISSGSEAEAIRYGNEILRD